MQSTYCYWLTVHFLGYLTMLINSVTSEAHLQNTYKFSLPRRELASPLQRSVSQCRLVWESCETQKYIVWAKWRVL
jgi:hypothetical protein